MTRNIWLYLWVALFALQALSLWVHQKWIHQQDLPMVQVEPGLLQLAERTNQLMQLQIQQKPAQAYAVGDRRSDKLVRRESLILELHQLQQDLLKVGVDIHIVEDLEAFLETMDGSESIFRMNAYIEGILDWIRPHATGASIAVLDRLNLFPDKDTRLPVLAFELAGSPGHMAESLLWSTSENSHWDLVEFDLLIPADERICWLRGSCAFLEQ